MWGRLVETIRGWKKVRQNQTNAVVLSAEISCHHNKNVGQYLKYEMSNAKQVSKSLSRLMKNPITK